MRKLILGIFAVVCVQFAFVIYTALQSPLDVAVGPIFSDVMPDHTAADIAEPPAAPIADELESDSSGAEPSRKRESPEPYRPARPEAPSITRSMNDRASRPEVRSNRSYDEFATLRPAAPSDFETVVIGYNRSPEISECDKVRYDVPQPKKRSYIAKVAPVIKKPWDWIKVAGSKLN